MYTLLIYNANIVNVYTKTVNRGSVLCCGSRIERLYYDKAADKEKPGISEQFPPADHSYDAQGAYLLPGLIDAHTHIEMSQMSAISFADAVLRCGTTTAILDPHDIVNAMGTEGARLLMQELAATKLKGIFMAPPCVPSAPSFEDSSCNITLEHVQQMVEEIHMYGIAETMDFKRVLHGEPELKKILDWARARGLMIDGHAPGLTGADLQHYRRLGPVTDHESTTPEEMYDRLSCGMYVILRRGSLKEPAKAPDFLSNIEDTSRILLSTDGCINVRDMVDKGHMNYALRQLTAEGINAMTAVQMATINTASAYGLRDRGAIAPGLLADFCLVKDLTGFEAIDVIASGCLVSKDGHSPAQKSSFSYPAQALHTIRHRPMTPEDFVIKTPLETGQPDSQVNVRLLCLIEDTLDTKEQSAVLFSKNRQLIIEPGRDITRAAVIHRYEPDGRYSLGLISGFGPIKGAAACSIAQDTQNIIVVGSNETDMAAAVNKVISMNGGIAVYSSGACICTLPLPIAGIMTDIPAPRLADEMDAVTKAIQELGSTLRDPVFAMSMQIPLAVIPELALTNRGLLRVADGQFLSLFITPEETR